MEFPDLGKHCSLKECHRLDFLPIKCSSCKKIFCNEHYLFESHQCSSTHVQDHQVPICPLCNCPVPLKFGESLDYKVSEHIDQNCELRREKVFKNRCSVTNCRQKEMISLKCDFCGMNHCLKHRHPADHNCNKKLASNRSIKYQNNQLINRNWNSDPQEKRIPSRSFTIPASLNIFTKKSMNKFESMRSNVFKTFQKDPTTTTAQSRTANPAIIQTSRTISSSISHLQGDLTEEEALNIAITESLTSINSNDGQSGKQNTDSKNEHQSNVQSNQENCRIS